MPSRPRILTIRSLCSLLTALLLTSGLGSLAGTAQPASSSQTAEDVIPEVPDEPNVLDVQAPTGQILSWEDNDAWATHVRIHGVASNTTGYTLIDPTGWQIFIDQASRHDGIVEFYYTDLDLGVYTVIREDHGLDDPVTTFDTAQVLGHSTLTEAASSVGGTLLWLAQPLGWAMDLVTGEASAESCADTDQGGADCQAACPGTGWQWRRVESKIFWTPKIVLHSPFGGSATANVGHNDQSTTFITMGGWESTVASGTEFEVSGGQTQGLYQKMTWGLYEGQFYWDCRPIGPAWETKDIDQEPDGYVVNDQLSLTGESRYTDADDLSTPAGRHAVEVEIRFEEIEGEERTTDGGRTLALSDDTVTRIGGGLRFSKGPLSFRVIDIEAEDGTAHLYTYDLPKGGVWYIDYLDGIGRSMAFCRVDYTDCSTGHA